MRSSLALLIAMVSVAAVAQGWQTISSKEAGFKVNVPTQPQTSSRTDKDGQYSIQTRIWVASQGPSNYVVSVSFLPKGAPAQMTNNMIAGIKSGFVRTTGATVVSDRPATYSGIAGRHIAFKTAAGVVGAMWIVTRSNRVYTLTLGKQKGTYQAEQAKFFGSFRLTG